eukprot:TRINITY_DN16464_c0_g1_i1.p2 TRINITY_DN16464_c0_g1~~TRINITY_DN16464_c0_g1_i1.p2  ORF type:complete len:271 (+),score=72.51 TRINITY_DN16464_c0_g1_i1:76-813(+)
MPMAAPMPLASPPPPGAAMPMSPEAARHQHVVNHLACREAACPQGINPMDLAVWGARRDCYEPPSCEPPMVEERVVCAPQPVCAPQDPCQPMTVPMNRSTATFSYVDFGGRFSASPEYDAQGSPHGYYGPPAALTFANNQLACSAPPVPPCDPCAGGQAHGTPAFYGNAYPGANPTKAQHRAFDQYYQMRERELRGGQRPATRTVTRVVERPVVYKTKQVRTTAPSSPRYSQSPATRYSYAKTPN